MNGIVGLTRLLLNHPGQADEAAKQIRYIQRAAEELTELVDDLSRAAGNIDHPLLATHDVKRSALVVLTSSRGLAGGYNSHVLRAALGHLDRLAADGIETRVHMVGKKGISFFRFLRRPIAEQTASFGDRPKFEDVEPLANSLIDSFLKGEIASVYIAYMRFISAVK